MTNKLSPEQIAEMSEDCQCSCKELEQYKAWWERDSTSLGKALNEVSSLRAGKEQFRAAIEQLHAAVKTAQELAATRLMEIERLQKREKDLMGVIDSRDRALGFVPLDEVHASEPEAVAPFPYPTDRDGWICSVCHGWNGPKTRVCLHSHVPLDPQGASRDASPRSNDWADAKGGLPDNKL